jgi:predicted transposase YbfD/YdcC
LHDVFELVVIALCSTIAGGDGWVDAERFGKARLAWLRTFLRLENGIASHDTFGRVFARLDPAGLAECIQRWMDDIGQELDQHIAIDGKTLRGSFDTAAGKNPLHLVSAWATELRLTLGQVAVDSKSNEITAIPLLLELLDLKGATVTTDAMGCQKEIAAKIIDREGDYVLALKGNHEHLHAAVADAFEKAAEVDFQVPGVRRLVTVERSHGRTERREYTVLPAPETLPGFADWKGLCTIGMVLSLCMVNGVETAEVRYFLSSLPPRVRRFARLVRQHWGIENQLHWVLDVTFSEDASRIRKGMGAQTAAMFRRLAVSILGADTEVKDSIRGKRYAACLSTEVLERILLSFARK